MIGDEDQGTNRMKNGEELRVPLSDAALGILKGLQRGGPDDLVFPSPRGGMLSDATLGKFMRTGPGLGFKDEDGREAVPHGLRSTFRDWAAEETDHQNHVAEMALGHTVTNQVEAAYRRGDLFAKRAALMSDWATFCGY